LLDDHFPTDIAVIGDGDHPLPAGLVRTLGAVPHVTQAAGVTEAEIKDPRGQETPVYGIDDAVQRAVRSTDGAGLPAPGTVSVSKELRWGKEGQTVKLTAGKRSISLRIHLIADGSTPPRIPAADLAKLAPAAGVGAIWMRLDDGLDGDDRGDTLDAISTTASDQAPQSLVQGAVLERDSFDRIINTLLLLVTGLLAVAVVIAVIGVGNTLALSVVERRQESGLLRALGLTRNQLRWMLLWEAVLIAGVATLLGVVLGGVYGALGTSAAFAGAGPVTLAVPWGRVVVIVIVATAAGALASVLPSRRAARISPVEALAAT
jgi:putative ABC transport system permease protein